MAGFTARNPQLSISTETRLKLYRSMLECRVLEKRAYDLFMQNLIKGTSHLALGQEAIAAGFGLAMRPDDYTFCTYRGHNHTLVRGVGDDGDLGRAHGQLVGPHARQGRLDAPDERQAPHDGLVRDHRRALTIANGAAWSAQYRGTEQVAVCFFGDGTTNIGAFHEALNFAVIWKLPVVFVCENNLYMEYTSIHDVTAVEHPAADRASAYGLEPVLIDGNDVDVVYRTAQRALDLARKGGGPSLIEAETYRHGGHSRADPGKYRPDDEVKAWLAKDPLPRYRARLLELGHRRRRDREDRGRDERRDRSGHGDRAQRAAAAARARRQGRLG